MVAGAAAFALATAPGASADTGKISAQYQGYSTPASGQDPYASSNPQDVHVDGFGGQPTVTGLIRLNLESLPTGSMVDGLALVLTPNSSQADNVQPGSAAIQACLLDQPLTSDGYQANPPSYDCNSVHATGEPQTDGTWVFALAPLAERWEKDGNTGLALVAYPPANGTSVGVAPSAWSVGFDHTKTSAQVEFEPPASSSFFGGLAAPAFSGAGSSAPVAPAPAVHAAPAVNPAPAVAPQASPAPAQANGGGGSTAPQGSGPAQSAVTATPHVVAQWVWLTAALGAAALLMLLVSSMQQVLRGGMVDMRLRLGTALRASRSQLATPVAVLALASVFALGFTGQLTGGPGAAGGGLAGGAGGGLSGNGNGSGGTGAGGSSGATSHGGSGGVAGSGAGSSAAQSSAAASAAAAASAYAASNGGRDGIGVTSTTVRIGFIDLVNSQAANNAFGVKVAGEGPQASIEDTMVGWINHHGGIGGRQIQPFHITQDNARNESDPNANEEACRTLTEDYHVFAVIGGGGPPDDANANACYAESGTLNFDLQQATVDLGFLRQASPYVWFTADTALDRTMQWEIAGLQSRNYFKGGPNYKLGVVIAQDPVNERVYQQVTLPALENAGVSKPDTFEVPHDTISDIANTMKQAVAHFQLDGVTNVIFQGGGNYGAGSYALLFTLDAESQHYNPRYGFNTDDATTSLVGNVPQDQFANALAVGTVPGIDADDAHYAPWPSTPAEKKCAAIEANTYQPSSRSAGSGNSALVMLDICSAMLDLQQGAAPLVGQPLNAQLWANSFMQLGSSVFNALAYTAQVGPDHWDAPGGYRLLHAVLNCEGGNACFEFDSSTVYS